jgi:CubicO group peptidase (beta-lactamase class C family)
MSLLPETERALLHRIAVAQAKGRIPSLAAALVRGGRVVWFGGRGRVGDEPPTPDTQYRIGSITKTFVAVLIMRLRDEGRLDLNDPLDKHVPGTVLGDRTIGQLLSHTAGLSAEPPGDWWERTPGRDWAGLAGATGPDTLRHRAGRRFHYSNLGFAALGRLVAEARGTEWSAALHEEILTPLGMDRTTVRPAAPHAQGFGVHPWADVVLAEPEHDALAMAPAGQLWSTATDLSRWAAFVGGDTGGVLSPDTVAEMREPAAIEDGSAWASGYGLGLSVHLVGRRRMAGHAGSMPGFLATVLTDIEDDVAAVTLANTTSGVPIAGLTADLIGIVAEREPRIPDEWTPAEDHDPALLELTGPWYWGPSPYILRLLPDRRLSLAPVGQDASTGRFHPESDGTWTGLDGYRAGETLRVVRHPDGSVSHLNVHTFIFTRTPYDPGAPVPGGLDERGWHAP